MSAKFRVLVCGGRHYAHAWRVFEALEKLMRINGPLVVIEGEATGADTHAKTWAEEREGQGVELLPFPADWDRWGLDAGHIRNSEMLAEGEPDLVVAFPGGRGTRNMVWAAQHAGVPVCYGEDLDTFESVMENL